MKRAPNRVAGLILAAGKASRMGACKVLLPLAGKSALEQIVTRMRVAGVENIVVVTGRYEKKIRRAARRLGCRTAHNPDYETGMYSSVLTGVRALPKDTEAFFLLPADTPLVKSASYAELLHAFYEGGGDADVVCPTFGAVRGHPPLIGRALIEPILQWHGEGGLRGLLAARAVRSAEVPTGDRGALLDMDTPDDYERLKAYAKNENYPDDEACAELMAMMGTPQRVMRHAAMVTRCAELIADAVAADRRVKLCRPLLRAACLLHDIAKGHREHEAEGARWLRRRGYRRVAKVVATHKDLPERKKVGEAEILYLADKITDGEAVSTLSLRMFRMENRFAADSEALAAARRRLKTAMEIQRRVEALSGQPLSEILSAARVYPARP